MTNCPNCGAVITGAKCEYCGTKFGETQSLDEYVLENKYIENMLRIEEIYRRTLDEMRRYC